jgi:hypothetical protein
MFDRKIKYEMLEDMYEIDRKESIIDLFIQPTLKNKSCWWKNLSGFVGENSSNFEYIKTLHNDYIKGGTLRSVNTAATVRQCPAVTGIFKNSYIIKSPSDMVITLTSDGGYVYNSANDFMKVTSHPTEQFHTEKDNLFEGKMNLKFELPIALKTDKIPYLFLQPMYHNNIWFTVAIGVIEEKYTDRIKLNINTLVDIPKDEPVTYEIKAGDVLAYMWFPEKTKLVRSKDKFYEPIFKTKWSSKIKF